MKKIILMALIAGGIYLTGCSKTEAENKADKNNIKSVAKFEEGAQLSWISNIGSAIKKAKKGNKKILVNFTGSDWCKWCIKLDGEVFSKKEFAEYAAKHLILVKLDFPRTIEQSSETKAYNMAQGQKYQVRGYPTILLLDADGNLIKRTGYQPGGPVKYIEHLNEAS